MRISDWSSDVCSSDLGAEGEAALRRPQRAVQGDVDLDGLRVEAVVGQLEAAETRREVGGMSGLAVEAAVQRHREGAGGNGEGVCAGGGDRAARPVLACAEPVRAEQRRVGTEGVRSGNT